MPAQASDNDIFESNEVLRRQFSASPATMSQSLQVVIMRATDLQSAIPGTLPAAQVELRAIYNDEEIAFHKTTVMFAQFV